MITEIAPNWIVENVAQTVTFYTKKLGFQIEWMHEKDPRFAIVSRDKITLMFRQLQETGHTRPNRISYIKAGWHTDAAEAWDAYIWVNDVESLYKEIVSKKISVIKPIQDTEYGNRDFEIEDNNGYILCFGQRL